jgi:uncharacterized membrane protein YvbJ
MAFCEDCGNKLSETTKFCGECGAKVENKANIPESDQTKKKPVTRKVKVSKPKADAKATSVSTKDTVYLKTFFTKPRKKPKKAKNPRQIWLEQSIASAKSHTVGATAPTISVEDFSLSLVFFVVL